MTVAIQIFMLDVYIVHLVDRFAVTSFSRADVSTWHTYTPYRKANDQCCKMVCPVEVMIYFLKNIIVIISYREKLYLVVYPNWK